MRPVSAGKPPEEDASKVEYRGCRRVTPSAVFNISPSIGSPLLQGVEEKAQTILFDDLFDTADGGSEGLGRPQHPFF